MRPGAKGPYVKRVQEWLNLKRFTDPGWTYNVDVDSDYGPVTERVVKLFQQANQLVEDGIVGQKTYTALTRPMIKAFSRLPSDDATTIRQLIVGYAEQHLANHPMELNYSNMGPWVRAYMDGNEGKEWAWCLGFVQTILDQAYSTLDRSFLDIMPKTVGCDVLGDYGKLHNKLLVNSVLRNQQGQAKKGDAFLIAHMGYGWSHTGIVTDVIGTQVHTIEGNTNENGSPEGFEVRRKIRDFSIAKIDIYSVE
jgi:hypothetical protein